MDITLVDGTFMMGVQFHLHVGFTFTQFSLWWIYIYSIYAVVGFTFTQFSLWWTTKLEPINLN